MCMKNLNAIATIDALDKDNYIITEYDENDVKLIPFNQSLESSTAKLLITFNSCVIDGSDQVFKNTEGIYIQLRIIDSESEESLTLNEFYIELLNSDPIHAYKYLDFIECNKSFVHELNLNFTDYNSTKILLVLVKEKNELNNNWTIQSATSFKFKAI